MDVTILHLRHHIRIYKDKNPKPNVRDRIWLDLYLNPNPKWLQFQKWAPYPLYLKPKSSFIRIIGYLFATLKAHLFAKWKWIPCLKILETKFDASSMRSHALWSCLYPHFCGFWGSDPLPINWWFFHAFMKSTMIW